MAVLGALRSGVGLVTAVVPEAFVPAFAARAPEAMWFPAAETPDGALALENLTALRPHLARASAVVIGPGLGRERETLALVQGLLSLAECPVVLDADALQPQIIDTLGVRENRPVVITPHLGEFARLRSTAPNAGAGCAAALSPVENAELIDFAMARNLIAVLKGPSSRLTDGHAVWHNLAGGPVLARGGSGDILAGLIGGRLATDDGDSTLVRVAQGLVWHSLAADRLARHQGATAAVATDLLSHLAPTLNETAHEP
jgi:NAD(P)H-hydrate epimerase